MKRVKQTSDYSIYEKRSGRHAVKDKDRNWVHAEAKVEILKKEGLVKVFEPKPKEEEEPAGEEAAAEGAGESS